MVNPWMCSSVQELIIIRLFSEKRFHWLNVRRLFPGTLGIAIPIGTAFVGMGMSLPRLLFGKIFQLSGYL